MATSLELGIEAAKSGQMEEALAHLKDAIVEEPETPMYGSGFQHYRRRRKTNHLS